MSINSVEIARTSGFRGEIQVPSDKSLTHRALILAAMSQGECVVRSPLDAEDTRSTARCLGQLGLACRWDREVRIKGGRFEGAGLTLDCGNSGTTMRLLLGPLAGSPGVEAVLVGDESLSRRPMARVVEPLRMMGAVASGEYPPVSVSGRKLQGIDYVSPVASAQIKSCVLLAGVLADGTTRVLEPAPSRDHTERMLRHLGVPVEAQDGWIAVEGGSTWQGFEISVPGDISAAAFWMVAGALHPGSEVVLHNVGTNPTRSGILDVFRQAGVQTTMQDERTEFGEPVATIAVPGGGDLRPFEVSGNLVPRLIDEIPALAVMATQCPGTTVFSDAQELRVKESDRLKTVTRILRQMGADVEERPDGMVVNGPTPLTGTTVECHGDHRIGMAFAIAGTIATGNTLLQGVESVATSYPGFFDELRRCAGA